MRISHLIVNNYRNLKNIDTKTNNVVIFIGDNNSGKSNLLKAITLPFMNNEIGGINKNLGWQDINEEVREKYYSFLKDNLDDIQSKNCSLDEFIECLPEVKVRVSFVPQDDGEEYYIRNWIDDVDDDSPTFAIQYHFKVEDPGSLFKHVTQVLQGVSEDSINYLKMNLLPIEFYKYQIIVPDVETKVSFADLAYFKYNALAAERDDFSNKASQLGSKSLVTLLNGKLGAEDKKNVEQSYEAFFNEVKNVNGLEDVFNWQKTAQLENADDFFEKITLLPNIPAMNSLLNNVKLGYGDEYLSAQGLGYRNLIYLFVMMNSLSIESDAALNILTIEEPEAHLSVSNEHLLASFINTISNDSSQLQLFISTHSSEFLNKLELKNVSIVAQGKTYDLERELEDNQVDYLAKKPNLDFLKFLYSRNCILVEGTTEEMLIRSYLSLQVGQLHDIEVISLHKGFREMLNIWSKVNQETNHKLGVIRDHDNQENARKEHEKYNENLNIYVTTTQERTLEPEIVSSGNNFDILQTYFWGKYGWNDIETPEKLSTKWEKAKASTMLQFCYDLGEQELQDIEMPSHISNVLEFLKTGNKS